MTDTIESPPAEVAGLLGAILTAERDRPLRLVDADCAVCGSHDAEPLAVGEDFEYRSSPDSFLAMQCNGCGLVYLDKRPADSEFARIYPDDYHAYDFSAERYGPVYRVRRRLEARRLLKVARRLPRRARILDVGCGDGFHLALLRDFGRPGWELEGVEPDLRAVERARAEGLRVQERIVQTADVEPGSVDLALLIQTIEHVSDPAGVLTSIRQLLRPGGRLLVVTDNTGTLDFALFKRRHWGGYHFPRHWNLFNARSLRMLATDAGFEVDALTTMTSPVNWVYSLRNMLDDWGAPRRVVDRFSLEAVPALGVFTVFDALNRAAGRGALLRAVLRRPDGDAEEVA